MAQILGFSLTIDFPSDGALWGELLENGSYTGLTGDAQFGRIEIGFAAFWAIFSYIPYVDLTRVHYFDFFHFLVPVPSPKPFWMTYLFAFDFNIWVFCLGSIILSILTMIILSKVKVAPDLVLKSISTLSYLVMLFGLLFTQSNNRLLMIR